MREPILVLVAALLLAGCATMTPPPAAGDSSLITGQLKIDVSGIGTAVNGADGMLNTDIPYAAALIIRNETSGKVSEIRTTVPGGFFALANAEPGRYRLLELWGQVHTPNSYVTIISSFDKSPEFEVQPGRVANLGVNTWSFFFDLTRSVSTNSFAFGSGFPVIPGASAWAGHASDQAALSGEVAATAVAVALPPRDTGGGYRILIP